MPLYKYKGIFKESGKKTSGRFWALNLSDAEDKITKMKLINTLISEIPNSKINKVLHLRKVKKMDLIFFLTQFHNLIKRRIMPDKALEIIKTASGNKTIEIAISKMISDIKNGVQFGETFKKSSEIFFYKTMPQNCLSIIESGAKSGPEAFSKSVLSAVNLLKKSDELNKKIISSLTYPIFLIFSSLSIIIYLFAFTIPNIVSIFKEFSNAKLPAVTILMISISSFIATYWFYIVAFSIFVSIIFFLLRKTENFGLFVDNLLLKLPYCGNIIRKQSVSNFTNSLSIMLESGLDIIDALGNLSKISSNRIFNNSIQNIILDVKNGKSLAKSIDNTKIFPSEIKSLVEVGEKIDELPSILGHISNTYEKEIEYKMESFTTILEPVIILLLGIFVGITVIAIITPLFELSGI